MPPRISNVPLSLQWISVGKDQLLFGLGELTGDLWTAVLKEPD